MRNNIYAMDMLLIDEDLEKVAGGANGEKQKCYMVDCVTPYGQSIVVYFKDYFEAVKFCHRVNVDPICIKIVDFPYEL
ncbi:hypothetical protein [Butyrivibrio sp. VCB2006]|uniref:hypothetical protein n=1 Tax=Butyrivibrio sp. VCB2006 TaxID=1280679 RepID=UPI00040B11C8|nr:hypothetical protein [Butyrivibrio sp. VCB2006]